MDTINPSVWAFLGVFITATFAYFSTRRKHKHEGAVALTESAVALLEQYRLANQECQDELEKCRTTLQKRPKRKKR